MNTIPRATVSIEDVYNASGIVGIRIRFNTEDLAVEVAHELSSAITIQAQRWAERSRASSAKSGPIAITVRRVKDLPGDARVLISDTDSDVMYALDPYAITEGGASAFEQVLIGRTATWARGGDR
ncbi:hypothetical protein ACIBJC_15075 [Streptomyces sp. NPDC050509]|uniref:hypothetical protein n=1 Tax=Streptomyces sp. NPDC050509 TaxID=3365620 RepID=UPI00378FA195